MKVSDIERERRKKISASWTPKRRKAWAKEMRRRNLLNPPSKKPGVGAKISKSNKGKPKPHSKEHEKNRLAALRTPEYRENRSRITKDRFSDPKERRKHGKRMAQVYLDKGGYTEEERRELSVRASRDMTPEKKVLMRKGLAKALRSDNGTSLEKALYRMLRCAGIPYRRQKYLGRAIADAYSPKPYRIVWEADGPRWHDEKRDAKRDARLMRRNNVTCVIRLSPEDLKPWTRRRNRSRRKV